MSKADYSLERGLPASVETEKVILGSILLNNELYDQAAEILTRDHFSLDAHRRIFDRMTDLVEADKPIDFIMLAQEFEKNKEVEAVGGISYLSSLIDGVPERPSIRSYAEIVRDKALLRGVINIAQRTIADAIDSGVGATEVMSRMEAEVMQLSDDVEDRGFVTLADSVREAGSLDNYVMRMMDPAAMSGMPTGLKDIDRVIGGLRPDELIVVAARPSMGKSAFAGNVIENVLTDDPERVVAWFALEMSKQAVESRLLASSARVDLRSLRFGVQGSMTQKIDLGHALERLLEQRCFIDDSSYQTPIKMRAKCRQLKRKFDRLDLIVVDYLQLVSGGGKFESREKEVSFISRGMKALAKQLHVPVVALSQLNRTVEGRSDKRPILSDLRESGSLEQDADIVAFLHRPEVYDDDPDLHGIAEFIVGKQREGPIETVKLAWLKQYTRFENLAME